MRMILYPILYTIFIVLIDLLEMSYGWIFVLFIICTIVAFIDSINQELKDTK